MDKIYLDEKGYQEYLKGIDLIKEKIKKNSSDITEYQSDDAYGDGWHDNFAYEQAIKKENSLLHELEVKLKGLNNIEIVKSSANKDKVNIGSFVDIKFDGEKEIESFCVTGNSSSKIDNDIFEITLNSPLGKAIYGKKANDIFSYEVNGKEVKGKIIKISN